MMGVLHALEIFGQAVENLVALLFRVGVAFEHLPHLLQRFAGNVLAREVLQHGVGQAVLAGLAADVHLFDDPPGRKLLDRPDLFLQVFLVRKRLDDGLQFRLRVLIAFAFQEQLDQLQPVVEVLGVDLARDNLAQHIAGNRTRGDPHVPDICRLGGQPLDFGPVRRDLGDPLDHVQGPLVRHDRDDAPAEFVPGLHPHDRAQPGNVKAGHRHALRDLDLDRRKRLPVIPLLDIQHLQFGEERPREVVVDHLDRLHGRPVSALGLERVFGQTGHVGQGSAQDPAVAHDQSLGPGMVGCSGRGHQQDGNEEPAGARPAARAPSLPARSPIVAHEATPLVPSRVRTDWMAPQVRPGLPVAKADIETGFVSF